MHAHRDSEGVIPEVPKSQSMPRPRAIARAPAAVRPRIQMGEFGSLWLDAAGPFALVASQLLYALGPFFGASAMRLARLLEYGHPNSEDGRRPLVDDDDLPQDPGFHGD